MSTKRSPLLSYDTLTDESMGFYGLAETPEVSEQVPTQVELEAEINRSHPGSQRLLEQTVDLTFIED